MQIHPGYFSRQSSQKTKTVVSEVNVHPSTKNKIQNKTRFNFYLPAICFITIGFGLFVYLYLIRSLGPFAWDEAHHSTFSHLIAGSIIQGDWSAFLRYTSGQVYWPFLHSWVSAIFLLVGGYNYQAARLTSLALGFASILLLYKTGVRLSPRGSRATSVLAAVMLAISPIFQVYSGTAMIENLGLLLTIILIDLQFAAWDKEKPRLFFITGLVLGLLFLSKYIYAIFFGLALILFWISLLLFPDGGTRRKFIRENIAYIGLGFCLIWGIWMIIPPTAPKLARLLYRVQDTGRWNPFGYTTTENQFFYLRALFYAYTFSIGVFILYLAGVIYGFIRIKELRIRLLLLLFLATIIPLSLIVNSQERFIYTAVPALYLLTAYFLSRLWRRLSRVWRWVIFSLIGIIIAGDLIKLPSYIKQVGNLVLGASSFNTVNHLDNSIFYHLTSCPELLRPPRKFYNPAAAEASPHHSTEEVLDFIWEKTGPRGSICAPFYIGTLSPHLWTWHARIKNRAVYLEWAPEADCYISLNVSDNSPYRVLGNRRLIEGRNRQWDEYLKDLQQRGLMKLCYEKYFADNGLKVSIYKKSLPLENPVWKELQFP